MLPVALRYPRELHQTSHSNIVQGSGHDQDNDLLTRYLKLAPYEFSGTPADPDIAENWVRNAERLLKRVGGTTFDWVNMETFKSQGAARDWWESAELTEAEPITWNKFKDLFLLEFVTDVSRDRKRSEFMSIEQGEMSLAEFVNKYRSLSRYAPEVTSNDEVNARKFIRALKPQISRQLAGFQIKTFQEALSRGFRIKREEVNRITEQERRLKQVPPQFQAIQDSPKQQMTSMPNQTFFSPSGQSWKMDSSFRLPPSSSALLRPGIVRPNSTRSPGQAFRPQGRYVRLQQVRPSGSVNISQMGCYYCGEPGHIRMNCPLLLHEGSSSHKGMVYSVTQEETPTQKGLQEGGIVYVVMQGDGSATD